MSEATPIAGTPIKPKRKIWRSILSFILILIAVILAPLSVTTVFAVSQISDTQRYVETVAPLAESEAIQTAVADRISDQVIEAINVDELVDEAVAAITSGRDLPPRVADGLAGLAAPIESGVDSFIREKVTEIVQSESFVVAWREANEIGHGELVKLLSGDDSGAVTAQDGALVLNLNQVLAQVKAALIDAGFTRAENIPETDAEFVLFQSDEIATVQSYYSAAQDVGYFLPIATVVIALLGILAANRRRVAVGALGLGVFVVMMAIVLGLDVARTAYIDALGTNISIAAASDSFDTVTVFLFQGVGALAVVGLVLFLAALLTSSLQFARVIRQQIIKAAGWTNQGLSRLGIPMARLQPFWARNARWARVIVVVVAIVALWLPEYTKPSDVLWATFWLLVALFVIQVLATSRPNAETETEQRRPSQSPELATSDHSQ
ncbi:MAG: hypothetical protein K0U64_02055 [Actinomycetia bacterium]|nr:hypothetical protein [Actinomycetes bacterium]